MKIFVILTAVAALIPFAASAQSLYQQELEKIQSNRGYDLTPLYGSETSQQENCFGYGCSNRDRDRTRDEPTTPELENSFSRSGVPQNSIGNNIINQLQPR